MCIRDRFGIAPAEALACGRPVVTTNASALPEVVDHGKNGFLCQRDDVAAYAEAVRRLGEDAVMRRRFGEHGREKVARCFGYDQLAGGLIGVYERLLGSEGRGRLEGRQAPPRKSSL